MDVKGPLLERVSAAGGEASGTEAAEGIRKCVALARQGSTRTKHRSIADGKRSTGGVGEASFGDRDRIGAPLAHSPLPGTGGGGKCFYFLPAMLCLHKL